MARAIAPELAACLERENPYTEMGVEVAAPDVGRVLRRPLDQLLLSPDPLVSLSPAASLVAAPAGGVEITPTSAPLVTYATDSGSYIGLLPAVVGYPLRALQWQADPAFDRAVLRSIAVAIARVPNLAGQFYAPAITLQIWRAAASQGTKGVDASGNPIPFTQWSFSPLIPGGVKLDAKTVWGPSKSLTSNTITFDLTGYGVVIDGSREGLPSNLQNGRATYYIELTTDIGTADSVRWFFNTASSASPAGIGTFNNATWAKSSNADPGTITTAAGVPNITINCDQYNPGANVVAVYHCDLGAAPAAGSTGRVRFERALPAGTSATLDLATAGATGPWTTVKDGDAVASAQQHYWLRVTLTASSSHRSTPVLTAVGVEFRAVYDASIESIITPLGRDVDLPSCAASIGDGALRVLRLGRRDFEDVASQLGSTAPATKLEVDLFLRSQHPAVTRDRWLRMDRASVIDRVPTETGERFVLRSYQDTLKRQIPLPVETINSAFAVASGSTTTAVKITSALPGTSATGNEYDGKRYYMRVQKSSVAVFAGNPGFEIVGNTGTGQLDFAANDLPGVLAMGDVVEVHSGVLAAPALVYQDADPAVIWLDLLENQLQVPPERIGVGHLPRGGLPPTVGDIAPGDVTTQAKRKVSIAIDQAEAGDALLDQVSRLLGGATIEIDGQICFVQLYPLRDGNGNISVPLPPSRYTWDPRDYFGLNCPQGLTKRQTSVKCSYGVDLTVPEASRFAPSITDYADVDAVQWLALTDAESHGIAAIDDAIARWCFNSTDYGFFLASELCWQQCRYFATGMRIWDWSTRDQFPELHPGDVVTVITDAYTDFDLVAQAPVVGWQAYTLVLLGVDAGGRKFRGVVPGLNPTTARAIGGRPGLDLGAALATESGATILANFREIADADPTRVRYGWTRGALVDRVWIYTRLRLIGATVEGWPVAGDLPDDALPTGVDELVLDRPPDGYRLFVQVEARLKDGRYTVGDLHRVTVEPNSALGVDVTPLESPGSGTLRVAITDPAGVLASASPVTFRRTIDQVVAIVAPTLVYGSTYERTEPLDRKHVVRLEPVLTYADGTQETLAPYSFDADRIADIIAGPTVSFDGSTATVTARYDTDATAGASRAFYRLDGGAWQPLTVAADLSVAFAVTADIDATHLIELYAVNPDGSAGPITSVTIDKLGIVEGTVSLTSVVPTRVDATHFTVDCTRSGFPSGTEFNITWSVDGITPGGFVDSLTDSDFPKSITVGSSMGATPSGLVTVDAVLSGQVIATKKWNGPFAL